MATQDTTTDDEISKTDDDVETSHEEDELEIEDQDESDEETEDTDEDDDSDSDDDESETDEDDPEFTKRFTQFKGDTYEEYVPELEKAYGNAVGEINRLKNSSDENQAKIDRVMAAAGKDAKFAEKLNELLGEDAEEVTVDPAILKARQDLEESMEKDYNDFIDLHPELESDQQLAEKVLTQVKEFGAIARKQNKVLSMGEALRKAWTFLGLEDDSKEKIAAKAKEVAAKPKAGNSVKKKPVKKGYTEEQIKVAEKWGVKLKQLRKH